VTGLAVEVANRTRRPIDAGAVVRLVAAVLEGEGVGAGELGVHFVGEDRMRELNREHRGLDESTDVLSFPLEDVGDGFAPPADDQVPRLLGDVVVCPAVAERQAKASGTPLAFELALLCVHGTLHVLGYDHETDAGQMALRQGRYLDDARWEGLLGD
jgi:probable rRNA maturation factor